MSISPDKELFTQLIQDNKGIIYKVCNSYCNNNEDRDDLAQEIVYHVWKSFAGFNYEYKFSTWLYRIALNVAISFYRKEKKSINKVFFSDGHDPGLHATALWEESTAENGNEQQLALLFQFINELKEIDRSVMLLYLDDKTYKEIAAIIGISESNVATKINRIKEKLKSNFSTTKNI